MTGLLFLMCTRRGSISKKIPKIRAGFYGLDAITDTPPAPVKFFREQLGTPPSTVPQHLFQQPFFR